MIEQGVKFAIIHLLVAIVAIAELYKRSQNKVDLGPPWGIQDCATSAVSLDITNIIVSIVLFLSYVIISFSRR